MAAPHDGGSQTLQGLVWRAILTVLLAGGLTTLLPVGLPKIALAEGPWLTGEPLRTALSQKVSVVWSNISVRQALERLSHSQKVAIMLDRRVDPDRKIELSFDNVPLAEGFQRIASRLGLGATMLGPVVYFGPTSTAGRLRTVGALRLQDAEELPREVRTRWLQPHPWKWGDLASPRELLSAVGKNAGLRIDGLEQIPADLWARADLPPLNLPERLTLLLAQFDLTYQQAADGKSIRLVPLPEKPLVERRYTVAGSPSALAAKLQQMKLLSGAQIGVDDGKLVVRGRQEDHDAIEEVLAGGKAHRTTIGEGQKVYTLQVELPVGKLLESLGPRMGLEIHVDQRAIADAGISLAKKVKLDVKEVSADDLLRAVLDPAGLTFTRKGNVVDVQLKK